MRRYEMGSLGRTNTIHEPTRSKHEEDTKFKPFRVISWIVPIVVAEAHHFSAGQVKLNLEIRNYFSRIFRAHYASRSNPNFFFCNSLLLIHNPP